MNKINGVDVSECEFYAETRKLSDNLNGGYYIQHYYCDLQGDNYCICNKNPNCYFKKFKRLQKENEELKNRLKTLDDEEFVYEVTEIEYNNFKKMNKCKQALEEIKKTILNYKSKEWNCFNDMDAKLEKISEILDEALNDRN